MSVPILPPTGVPSHRIPEVGRRPDAEGLPAYLAETYYWAYVDRRAVALLDHDVVVDVILWGNRRRLQGAVLDRVNQGSSVLLASHVYGGFVAELARRTGENGRLDVLDLVPNQVARCRRKLIDMPWAKARLGDVERPPDGAYDTVVSIFLLHELPDPVRGRVVDALLERVRPRGEAIFLDYHRPRRWHPLRPLMHLVFSCFEPFAEAMWRTPIPRLASRTDDIDWQTQEVFGGLYQITTARRRAAAHRCPQ
jgi:SAM-dependent methyltransferase